MYNAHDLNLFKCNCTMFDCMVNVQTWFTSMSMYRLLEGDIFVIFF